MANPPMRREVMEEAAAALAAHGSQAKAARALGVDRCTYRHRLAKAAAAGLVGGPPIPPIAVPPEGFVVTRNAAEYDEAGNLRKQWVATRAAPGEDYAVPAGHSVKGESVLLTPDGRVAAKWVKTRESGAGEFLVQALAERFAAYAGAASPLPEPSATEGETLTLYPLPDLHFGMYSWSPETGSDYDVEIAASLARQAVAALVSQSRPSRRAVILGLGDYFHQNDQKNATPASGHRLDVDGRWGRVFAAGAALMTDLVDLVAQKHGDVQVALLPGNHDEDAAVTLRVALDLFYRSTPRVSVYMEPGLHWYERFGKVLLGATHGHTMKPDRMAMLLAADRPKDWGETEHRHFMFGHVHHESAKEVGPVRVESFGTPAARDAFAQAGGYRSGRSLTAITFHEEAGEIGRHRVNISPAGKPRVRVAAKSAAA